MPELPEVETVRRGLQNLLVGHAVKNVQVFDSPKSFPNTSADTEQFLVGAQVKAARRRAKVLIIDLDSDYSLVIHLKMTGQLVYVKAPNDKSQKTNTGSLELGASDLELAEPSVRFGAGHPNDSLTGKLPDRSTRVMFTLDQKAHLYFNDQRKFGWVRLLPTVEVPNIDFMKKVGPEPLEDSFTNKEFINRLQKRANTTIKAALLDQTVVAGIGNIYADESLWGAKIHPSTRVKDIPESKLKKLFIEIRYVLNLSIEKGGSTDRNYVDAEGKRGSYLSFARVFRRENQPCLRCGTTIIKSKVAGRGTHTCPKCQKLS